VEQTHHDCRFFVTYTGVTLPFNLVNAIEPESLANRNTYIRAYFDKAGQLMGFHKVVYGEVELTHRYHYYDSGVLKKAEIIMLDEDPVQLDFDETGAQISSG
jgi:hypothetical protein